MRSLLFLGAGMLLCVIILASIIIINLMNSRSLKNPLSSLSHLGQTQKKNDISTTPQPTQNCQQFPLAIGCGTVNASINICSKQYPNYPPLADILTTPANPNRGVYTGTISALNTSLHRITVVSAISGKSFTFQGGSVNGALYDIHHDPIDDFTMLQTNVKAFISFPCSQKTGTFKLNQFQIVQ